MLLNPGRPSRCAAYTDSWSQSPQPSVYLAKQSDHGVGSRAAAPDETWLAQGNQYDSAWVGPAFGSETRFAQARGSRAADKLEDTVKTTIELPDETVSLHELVHRALQGDEIILAEAGTPLVRLVPITPSLRAAQRRRAGLSEGTAMIADDFDAPLPDDFWLGEA